MPLMISIAPKEGPGKSFCPQMTGHNCVVKTFSMFLISAPESAGNSFSAESEFFKFPDNFPVD